MTRTCPSTHSCRVTDRLCTAGGVYTCSGSAAILCLPPRALSISTLRTLTARRNPSVRTQTTSNTSLRHANGLKIRNHLIVEPSVRFLGNSMRRRFGICKVPLLQLGTLQLHSLADITFFRVADLFSRTLTVSEKWFDLLDDILTGFKSRFSFFSNLDFPG